MNQDTFSVQSQKQISHPFTPAIDSKHICPDIIITRLHSGTDNKSIVVDTKNKFSFTESGSLIVSNADIYQTYYYAKLLNTNVAILLYPGDSETHTSYPIKGSDGEAAFARKMTNKMHELLSSGRDIFKMTLNEQDFYFVIWRIDLSGTLQHTAHSVAQLCQFISDVSQRKVLN